MPSLEEACLFWITKDHPVDFGEKVQVGNPFILTQKVKEANHTLIEGLQVSKNTAVTLNTLECLNLSLF